MAEKLLLRCQVNPRWASEEIARLSMLIDRYVNINEVLPEHMEAVMDAIKRHKSNEG